MLTVVAGGFVLEVGAEGAFWLVAETGPSWE